MAKRNSSGDIVPKVFWVFNLTFFIVSIWFYVHLHPMVKSIPTGIAISSSNQIVPTSNLNQMESLKQELIQTKEILHRGILIGYYVSVALTWLFLLNLVIFSPWKPLRKRT